MDDITEELNGNDIQVVCLPPHSSHLLQILDVAIFGPMKDGQKSRKNLEIILSRFIYR